MSRADPSELSDEIEGILLRTAFEAHEAIARGVPLAAAATDEAAFPALHRLHAGIGDAIEMSTSPDLAAWLEQAERNARRLDELRGGLARLAIAGRPLEVALARFLLFEAVRARLLVAAWATGTAFEAVGGEGEQVDEIAAREVALLIESAIGQGPSSEERAGERGNHDDGPPVRQFRLLLAGAMVELTRHSELLRQALATTQRDRVDALAERAALEARLRELDPVDALLVRNELARYLGEERLTVDELIRRHPVLLGGRNRDALDQRASRFRRRLRAGGLAAIRRREGPSLAEWLAKSD